MALLTALLMVADRKEIFLDFLTVFAAESEREGKSGGVEVKNGAAANRGGEGRGLAKAGLFQTRAERETVPSKGGRGQRWEEGGKGKRRRTGTAKKKREGGGAAGGQIIKEKDVAGRYFSATFYFSDGAIRKVSLGRGIGNSLFLQ